MDSTELLDAPALEVLEWFLSRYEDLGRIIEDDIPSWERPWRRGIINLLEHMLHPDFEHLWSGTYQQSHKVRLDLLRRLGLPENADQSPKSPTQAYDPYGLGCDWESVKIGFPTLLEECGLDYLFTKRHLPQGRAWIPDWLEYAVPRQAFGLGELPQSPWPHSYESNDEKNKSWFLGPARVQSRTLFVDAMGTVSTWCLEWPPREVEYHDRHAAYMPPGLEDARSFLCSLARTPEPEGCVRVFPQHRSLLARHMEDEGVDDKLEWPSREADYFDGHAAYEPARPQAAKSFLRHLAKTFTQPNTHNPVRGVHTLRQMCVAAVNAAERQKVVKRQEDKAHALVDATKAKAYSLVDAIIHVNLTFAVEKVGYNFLDIDAQEYARAKFARLGIGEGSPEPGPEPGAGGSKADGDCPIPRETTRQVCRSLWRLYSRRRSGGGLTLTVKA